MISKQSLKTYNTDELVDVVNRLPARNFGYREFDALQQCTSATVSDNYPESMTVIELEAPNETVSLLYDDTADRNFKEPVFIG